MGSRGWMMLSRSMPMDLCPCLSPERERETERETEREREAYLLCLLPDARAQRLHLLGRALLLLLWVPAGPSQPEVKIPANPHLPYLVLSLTFLSPLENCMCTSWPVWHAVGAQ